jgi:uncharacterized protein (TIGR03085 family)
VPPSHVDLERLEAVSALRAAGPDAPTLCEGWTTRDLAAHLVAREQRPDADLGMVVPALERWTDRVRDRYARRDFEALLERIERGPARLSPWRWPGVENALNLLEYFVHTEDVRRAAPSWQPRKLDPEHEAQVWHSFARQAKLAFRGRRTAVELRTPDGARRVALDGPAPAKVIVGEVGELVLYAFGRRAHALVTTSGG